MRQRADVCCLVEQHILRAWDRNLQGLPTQGSVARPQVLLLWVRWITGHILTFMIGGPDLIVPLYKGRVPWLWTPEHTSPPSPLCGTGIKKYLRHLMEDHLWSSIPWPFSHQQILYFSPVGLLPPLAAHARLIVGNLTISKWLQIYHNLINYFDVIIFKKKTFQIISGEIENFKFPS